MKKKENQQREKQPKKAEENLVPTLKISTRGRIFEGTVIKKFPTRVVIETERTVKIPKYERFAKKQTRIHARLPENIQVEIGDLVKAQECRPLSKIVHFIVIKKLSKEEAQ